MRVQLNSRRALESQETDMVSLMVLYYTQK